MRKSPWGSLKMPESLRGRTALITGAAQRLGLATALALAGEGVNIIVHYRTSVTEAETLRALLLARGVRAWLVTGDLTQPEEYETLIERAAAVAGPFDILVNNASIFPPDSLETMTLAQLTENIELNAWAPFTLGRAFARRVGQGSIVNFLDARLPGYDWKHVSYMLSKQLLAVLTRMMALEYAPRITVNAVAPGLILPPPGKDESYLEPLEALVPLRRHGKAEDIGAAVVYLLQNSYLTGQVICVDGGRHLKEPTDGSYPD